MGLAPDPRFLFPALPTLLQRLGPLSLTGTAQRTGPDRPVTADPAAMQARAGSRNLQAHRPLGTARVEGDSRAGNRDGIVSAAPAAKRISAAAAVEHTLAFRGAAGEPGIQNL
ncbi:hypothetical protein GCM10007890_23580 [Methylobacterium tardum]|uniref:Uncharacterized protein n=1 Tax=Methylobacterium tardum TaxID=374432 RepID=A0AA37WQT6_9HYPH|nr:hypothetical protein GCM10007890_23580 [Methylobacterium tardum]